MTKEYDSCEGPPGTDHREGGQSFLTELHRRMEISATQDWRVIVCNEMYVRLTALQAGRSHGEFREHMKDAGVQGDIWRMRREALALSLDQVGIAAGISAWDLAFLEAGIPPPEGLPQSTAARLNCILGAQRQR